MSEEFRLVRIFLASPGDLEDERRLIRGVEEELNCELAPYLGFRIELKGWEDTLSGSGRPQAIINQELDRCELFIGMMWKRWGTPPASGSEYTSGFEEEFELSMSRQQRTGEPEMAMYFKAIDHTFQEDPGEGLKKVLAFKKRVASERVIFYEEFSDPHQLQKRVRLKIQQYLISLNEADKKGREEEQTQTKIVTSDTDSTKKQESTKRTSYAASYGFLKGFIEKIEASDGDENITPLEVARFRLLSNTMSKPGNHEPFLGVHDANIIYSNKQVRYGPIEVMKLIDCGLKNISHENAPLWHWCNLYGGVIDGEVLPYKSLSGNDIGVGSLEVMRLLGSVLPTKGDYIDRDVFIAAWLSENSSGNKKIAALRYLKSHGIHEDLQLIQAELDQADSKTSRIALEAIMSILLRYSKNDALKTAYSNQYDFFDEELLEKVLSTPSNLDEKTLKLGLKHRNKKIRLASFKSLSKEGDFSANELQELKNDPSSQVRKEVVSFLLSNNDPLGEDQVKGILIKPKKGGGLLALSSSDNKGEIYYDEYLRSKYSDLPEKQLLAIIENGIILNNPPYIELCRRYFRNHSEELRLNVDDQFKGKFEADIEILINIGLSNKSIEDTRALEEFINKGLIRQALDVLCEKGEVKDIDRIRRNMRSDSTKSSENEIEYMRKLGEWEDIPYLFKAEKDIASHSTSLLTSSINQDWHRSVANAVYHIGKGRLNELLQMDIPPRILVELIKVCASSRFSEISDTTCLCLLNNENDGVRKFASLKSVQSFKKSRLVFLLEHVVGRDHQYYNVIFWLDFGVSLSKPRIRQAINIIFSE
jgi:uncharacterized protein DUF4062